MPDEQTAEQQARRTFLKTLAASLTVPLATGCEGDKSKNGEGGLRYGMLIDLRKCIGCHACTVSCKSEFDVTLGHWRSWVSEVEKGAYPEVKRHFIPQLCNHCSDSPCVEVCPTGASFQKENGLVLVNEDRCIACSACIAACPYGTRYLDPKEKVVKKCDFCEHRLDHGLEPSCVNTCAPRARIFGDLNDPDSEISQLIRDNPVQVLKPEMNTDPNVYYIGLDSDVASALKKPRSLDGGC